jgi:hypothetical protein
LQKAFEDCGAHSARAAGYFIFRSVAGFRKILKTLLFLPPALGTDFGFLAGAGVLSPNLILK